MTMASVDDARHRDLETRVQSFLEGRQFFVSQKTYHDGHIPEPIKNAISQIFTPTALFVRAHADRWAIHIQSATMFFLEFKTSHNSKLSMEALPLYDHMRHAERGVRCLYCCRDGNGRECGFWADTTPPFDVLMRPPQRLPDLADWYDKWLPQYFPNVSYLRIDRTRGSDDPFLLVNSQEVSKLPPWQDLIECEIIGEQWD